MTSLTFVSVSLLYKTSRLHVTVRLFSNRSQRTSFQCNANIVTHFCSYILTSSVIYYYTDARQYGIYLLSRVRVAQPIKLQHLYSSRNLLHIVSGVLEDAEYIVKNTDVFPVVAWKQATAGNTSTFAG